MSDESRLRKLLAESVPEPPLAHERADRARDYALRRRRRRSGTAVAGSIAAVAAIVVPVVLGSSNESPGPTPRPSPNSTTPSGVVAGDFECPAPWIVEEPAPPNPALAGPKELPRAAIAARLCSGNFDPMGVGEPPDALTHDVDELVGLVNGLPTQKPCDTVPLDLGPTLGLAFQYRDGTVQVVQVERHGCGGVMVGGQIRGDRATAWRPIDRFRELLLTQRRASEAPQLTVSLECSGGSSIMASLEPPIELTRAVLCWRHLTETDSPTMSAPIPAADLASLLEDLNSHTTHVEIAEEECREQRVALTIVGQNDWGDRFALDGYCGPFNLTQDNANIWRPNTRSQSILDGLVASEPLVLPDPTSRTPAHQVVSLWADLYNAGETRRADALWSQDPPHPAGRVEVKTEGGRAIERPDYMSAPTIMREVTTLYWVRAEDGSYEDVHDVVFTLARLNTSLPWQIVSWVDRGVVQLGR